MRKAITKITTATQWPVVTPVTTTMVTPATSGPIMGMNSSSPPTAASTAPKGTPTMAKKIPKAVKAAADSTTSARM